MEEKKAQNFSDPLFGFEAVIGLEIHAQLLTKSKLFSPDSARFVEMENKHIHPVSLALPGVLPVLNEKALEYAVRAGLALNCRVNSHSLFARKNYFYPDLPKGYQISQYEKPICEKGYVEFERAGIRKKVRIQRVHIEEDAGRFHHKGHYSLVNFNRAGAPLVEIVSLPDLSSPEDAAEMARTVRKILKYIAVCDGNLQEGSLRCDCNVSVRKTGDKTLGVRTELKNLNSFKFIEKALKYEIRRQILSLNQGHKVVQETRLYDSNKNKTFPLRSKEEAGDYRYFPDPDLPPLILSEEWIKNQKKALPESFLQKADRFKDQYGLSAGEAFIITEEKSRADYFEQTVKEGAPPALTASWLINEVLARLNEEKTSDIEKSPVPPRRMGQLLKMIDQKEISGKIGKKVFAEMWSAKEDPAKIIKKKGLKQITDFKELSALAEETLKKFPRQVKEYGEGRTKVFGFFIGEIMKSCKGQADPKLLNQILKEKLKN